MANTTVSLVKRVKVKTWDEQDRPLPPKLRYCPVQMSGGKPRKDAVLVGGVGERHPEGVYYLDFYIGKTRKRLPAGRDTERAWDAKLKKEAELKAAARGVEIATPAASPQGPTLADAVKEYLEEVSATKKSSTHAAYSLSLGYFLECCKTCNKTYVSEVERTDLLAFKVYLRDTEELAARTQHNHFANVVSFLKANDRGRLAKKGDWPSYTEQEPEIYEPDEQAKLFAACDDRERLLFRFFLYTGFRDQEAQFTTWRDVNPTASTVSVRHKPQYGWTPKAYKERSVPVTSSFIQQLLAAKSSDAKQTDLVFPAPGGGPDKHMLRTLKDAAVKADLSPETVWLHKFRATFATTMLQAGVDLKTVQSWLGHSDLASTMRYLKAARGAAVQAKVESIWGSAQTP
jgi:integrase/recombinase XerD